MYDEVYSTSIMVCVLFLSYYPEVEVVVLDELLEKLASLRVTYATFLHKYEDVVQSSLKAQEAFIRTVTRLYPTTVGSDHSFQSCFNTLIEKEVSLFNIAYLNQLCSIFPDNIW